MAMPLPQAAVIRSAKIDGSMKRSPTMAMELGMASSCAQRRELLPDRPRSEPGIEIGRKHLRIAKGQCRIRRLWFVQIRSHPILGATSHVRIKAGCDGGDHGRASRACFAAAADPDIAFERGPQNHAERAAACRATGDPYIARQGSHGRIAI